MRLAPGCFGKFETVARPGLLAVLSVGSGVSVFRWGTEAVASDQFRRLHIVMSETVLQVSPELQRIRDVRAECEAQQARKPLELPKGPGVQVGAIVFLREISTSACCSGVGPD